jgi:ADP-heptose:LPS heptosyltransferase
MSKQFVLIAWGGLGDSLICTPAYRALRETYPDHKIIVYYPGKGHRDVLLHNPHIDSLRALKKSAMWRYPLHFFAYVFNRRELMKAHFMHFQHIPPSSVYNKNVVDLAAEILGVPLERRNVQLFFTEEEDTWARNALAGRQNIVIMHVHSRTSPNHNWRMENWVELVRQLPEYTFVQLGNAQESSSIEGALDWRGKTTLRQALCLIKHADSFVGVEASLAHATSAFDVPGVVLFGDTSPAHWGHENNINIYKEVSCAPCFFRLGGLPCPYNHECMELIMVEEVKEALVRQMGLRAAREKNGHSN